MDIGNMFLIAIIMAIASTLIITFLGNDAKVALSVITAAFIVVPLAVILIPASLPSAEMNPEIADDLMKRVIDSLWGESGEKLVQAAFSDIAGVLVGVFVSIFIKRES